MCSGLTKSNNRLARISVGQCLKFLDDIASVSTLPTQTNPQDLDPEYLENSFLVQ